ncbi:MAG: SgcJ/EcaC family oxidoreductase [Candidatus Krumholzibacteria bacterium]|nr:SgcJ/EcaC family oxidoreductase [Candidatus Krumholzibacteria bacterium]
MNPEKDVMRLFDEWNAAVRSGKPDQVVKLYATDAVLLPTFSNRVRHNHAEIRDYFAHFLKNGPSGRIDEGNVRVFGGLAVNSGTYTFRMRKGAVRKVNARFTFVYRWDGGRWLIVEHHSSAMPEQAVK